ncbi:hypothetical protein [Jannaschia rubra]|uniref:hypothetical protein n=1 Tax=Jannaschia rubra TaxID=282197 RepID=UPI002491E547|nr:hypothetical protein [Jannaschia rubra]
MVVVVLPSTDFLPGVALDRAPLTEQGFARHGWNGQRIDCAELCAQRLDSFEGTDRERGRDTTIDWGFCKVHRTPDGHDRGKVPTDRPAAS